MSSSETMFVIVGILVSLVSAIWLLAKSRTSYGATDAEPRINGKLLEDRKFELINLISQDSRAQLAWLLANFKADSPIELLNHSDLVTLVERQQSYYDELIILDPEAAESILSPKEFHKALIEAVVVNRRKKILKSE